MTSLGPVTPGSNMTIENSQCILNAAGSSVSGSGNTLTMNVALTFKPGFSGSRNIYMMSSDYKMAYSVWDTRGTWSVPPMINNGPGTYAIMPYLGNASAQIFSAVYTDPNGFKDLRATYLLINNSSDDFKSSCFVYYYAPYNQFYLLSDDGTASIGPVTPGSNMTIENSQCILNAAGSSVSGSGITLTMNVAITFKPGFSGSRNIYMMSSDYKMAYSAWDTRGTWSVPP